MTVGLLIVPTAGRSSVAGPPVPKAPVPSSLMVVVTVPVVIVALVGALRFTVKVSGPSYTRSSVMATVKVPVVDPAGMVKVPLAGVKSLPDVAVPLAVA